MEAKHIKVTNIPEYVFDDYLVITFGTVVPAVKMRVVLFDAQNATAIIDVETSAAVKEILCNYQTHPSWYNVKGQHLHVVEYIPLRIQHDPCTICLTGNVTKEQLKMFFEGKMQSINEQVTNIEEVNKTEFRVSFDSENTAQYVMEGSPYRVDGQELHARLYREQIPSYTDRVLIKGLSLDTTKDCLFNFLEAKVGAVPDTLVYGTAADTVMVTFRGSLDFTKLETVNGKVLDGSKLKIFRIPISNCIHVSNIDRNTGDDALRYYFENHKQIYGGAVERIQRIQQENAALVYFRDVGNVDDVLAKQYHVLEGQTVEIHLYIENLGYSITPIPVSVAIELPKITFLKSTRYGSKLEKHLADFHCKIEFLPQESVAVLKCTLTKDIKDFRTLAGAWETKVKKEVRYYIETYVHLKEIHAEAVTWDCLVMQEQQLLYGQKDVQCDYNRQKIMVVGSPLKMTVKVALEIEEKVEQLQKTTKEHTFLQRIELKVLDADNFKENIHSDVPKLDVYYNFVANEVCFKGMAASVMCAKRMLDKKLNSIVTRKQSISKFAAGLYTSNAMEEYTKKKLQQQKLLAAWELMDSHECSLTIGSLTPDSIDDCVKVISDAVQERQFKITSDSEMIIQSEGWKDQVNRWKLQFSNLVLISRNEKDMMVVCGTDENIKQLYTDVDSFIKNQACATQLPVQPEEAIRPGDTDHTMNPILCARSRMSFGEVVVYTVKGDITDIEVDVLVNSTDGSMKLDGALSVAIKTKGGHHVEEACRRYIEEHGRLSEGGVLVCEGGDLKAKHIVHAVGPLWHGGNENESSTLEQTVRAALQQAADRHAVSIAIPAISCGLRRYPVVQATRTITETLYRFLNENKNSSIHEVYLCDEVTEAVDGFTSAMKTTVGSKEVRTLTDLQSHFQGSDLELPDSITRTIVDTIKIGPIDVTVVVGDIAYEQVDSIVNITPRKLTFLAGSVCVSLNRVAGSGMQQEAIYKYPEGIRLGDLAETGGHNLQCRKNLEDLVGYSLWMAHHRHMSSIAIPIIPAVERELVDIPVKKIAVNMIREVVDVSELLSSGYPHDVRFIIPPKERETVKITLTKTKERRSSSNRLLRGR